MDLSLKEIVRTAAGRTEVLEAVARVYAELQTEIDQRRPLCVVSGRCCRFEEYGHRLYVSTIELAAFVAGLEPGKLESSLALWGGTGCPFQSGKLCGVHSIRPFGCRMFFCDATATDWQNERYERFHAQLKHLHETLGVPYRYMEWREALQALLLPES
jgi:Fe-S-cluster containining protein